MKTIKAIYRNGHIEPQEAIDFPEGTQLRITLVQPDDNADEDTSPEAIAAWINWYQSLEPLIITDDEAKKIQEARQEHSQWEQGQFDKYTDQLEKLWP